MTTSTHHHHRSAGTGVVDLITGKVTTEYYFDPSLLLIESSSGGSSNSNSGNTISTGNSSNAYSASNMTGRTSFGGGGSNSGVTSSTSTTTTTMTTTTYSQQFLQSKYLYLPCTIIKPLVDTTASTSTNTNTSALDVPVVSSAASSSAPSPPPPPSETTNGNNNNNNNNKKKKKKNKNNNNSNTKESTTSSWSSSVPATVPPKPQQQQNELRAPNLPFPGPTLVKITLDGSLHKITDSTKLIPISIDTGGNVSDILHLSYIHEAVIVHTLRLRYKRDMIYTRAGYNILISINPYKHVTTTNNSNESIYSERIMSLYRNSNKGSVVHQEEQEPHLFQVADRAYSALIDSIHDIPIGNSSGVDYDGYEETEGTYDHNSHHHSSSDIHTSVIHSTTKPVRNQSIIISGESGAGKTEATKIIMKYLVKNNNQMISVKTTSATTTIMTDSSTGTPTTKKKLTKGIATNDSQENLCHNNHHHKIAETLEQRVLSSNPLLETFGNAQTIRNNNSSRFGKFIHIYFSCTTGHITGATISNYLLEKTRITTQIDKERNYHIFYQLLCGGTIDMLNKFGLFVQPPQDELDDEQQQLVSGSSPTKTKKFEPFRYLGNYSPLSSSSFNNDRKAFQETISCLTSIGLSEMEQESVFGIVAAILHLGNVQFIDATNHDVNHGETAKIMDTDNSLLHLQKACELLGLQVDKVTEAILTKVIVVNGKSISKPQNVSMAEDKRDAFAKMTYSYLFLWLIKCINEKLSGNPTTTSGTTHKNWTASDRKGFIGVLDIYGFECFDVNGFEQLLINYCNEKLQRHFNRHLFEVEQELYSNEGVDWSYITFNDNKLCLELIEGGNGNVGILHTLDDAWGGMGTIDKKDEKFMKQILDKFGGDGSSGHPHFIASKFRIDRDFTIVHYAGEVKYTADGFVEKNMDTLSNELRELGEKSSNPVAKRVYMYSNNEAGTIPNSSSSSGTTTRSSIRGVSVGAQFRTSLQSLVADLERTQPHYIRCIKPNLSKVAGTYMAGEVLKQLRYSGMMEAIRIRQEGYALREAHESFYDRFSVLVSPEEMKKDGGEAGIVQLVKILSQRLGVTDADWQLGHSKIFLHRTLSDKLERLAKLRVHRAARTLTKFGGKVVRRRCGSFIATWIKFRICIRKHQHLQRSATKISALVRGYKARRYYRKSRCDIVLLQSHIRRIVALRLVQKRKDPFFNMNYKACKKMLAEMKDKLNNAIQEKNFELAKEIETTINGLNAKIEIIRPLTKESIGKDIATLRIKMEDAVKVKDFEKCASIQDRIDELVKKQSTVLSTDELRDALASAEMAMSRAVSSRDFKGAAEAQKNIDDLKVKLSDALADDEDNDDSGKTSDNENETVGCKFTTRFQLEAEIADIWGQITDAITDKDFSKANTLQKMLDEMEGQRSILPTAEELKVKVNSLKSEMEVLVSTKNFTQASVISDRISSLEAHLAEEIAAAQSSKQNTKNSKITYTKTTGETVCYQSRSKLEEDISSISNMISNCALQREFKKAELLQSDVDALIRLRDQLPTLDELWSTLTMKKAEMDTAASNRQFAIAEKLHQEIEVIELNLRNHSSKQDVLAETTEQKSVSQASANITTATVSSSNKSVIQAPVSTFSLHHSEKKVPNLVSVQSKSSDSTVYSQTNSVTNSTAPSTARIISKVQKTIPTGASVPLTTTTANKTPKPFSVDAISDRKSPDAPSTSSVLNHNSSSAASIKPLCKTRTVEKLRPVAPLVGQANQTVLSIAKHMTLRRGNACVVVNENGALAGIVTDTDLTRRVVAKLVDPGTTAVSEVMTPSPTCVATTDSAMDALTTMVENHFRHLPVVDSTGSVVGLLDIAKCLDDAITKLERKHERRTMATAESVAKQVASLQGASQASLKALLSSILSQELAGHTMATLRGVLAGKPKTVVSPMSSILEAGILMSQDRKAALIVEDRKLVGVFTFKDMMTRVLAKDVDVTTTPVSQVMTPNPEAVSPDISTLEALQVMHDQRFLTLPVCEDDGTVVGLVDVMDVIYGSGGTAGWRSIFTSAMEVHDDNSETGSGSRVSAPERKSSVIHNTPYVDGSENASITSRNTDFHSARNVESKVDKSVAKLRPMTPHLCSIDDSILSVAQLLKLQRGSACLVVNGDGTLSGIVTDTDITRRVVAKCVDPATTAVSKVMTRDPTCVSMSDSATDALSIMVENHFRHLPVVDDLGAVVGLLDIAKCLNDAISKLETKHENNSAVAESVIQKAVLDQGGDISQIQAIQGLLGNLLQQAFGSTSTPTLRSLLAGKPSTIVSPNTSIRDTGIVMGEVRKAALIVDEGELVGIFSFKDCMTRAVAAQVPLETTPVSEVMTPYPESVSPDITILEALQIMHDQHFLTLPVCEENGRVVGLVDVMDVIYGCGGADGWRSIFRCTMDIDDSTVVGSTISKQQKVVTPSNRQDSEIKKVTTPFTSPRIPPNIPTTLEFFDNDDQNSFAGSTIGDERGVSKVLSPDEMSESLMGSISNAFAFKVYCVSTGSSYRIRCEPKIQDLLLAVTTKTSIPTQRIQMEYKDDEGDTVRISSDDDVVEAFNLARRAGHKLAKILITEVEPKSKTMPVTTLAAGGVAAATLLGIMGILLSKRR